MKLAERALRGHFSYLSAMIHHGELLSETKRGTCIGWILPENRKNKAHRSVLFVFRALRRSVVGPFLGKLFIQWHGQPSRNGLALSANNWHICRGQTFNNITWTQHGLQVAWGGCMVWMCRKTTSLSRGGGEDFHHMELQVCGCELLFPHLCPCPGPSPCVVGDRMLSNSTFSLFSEQN